MSERDRDVQKQERRTRIKESRYNSRYEKITTEGLPKYLENECGKYEKSVMARFRCGNEERENKYWLKETERLCRMCREKAETIEHMSKECQEIREVSECREEILNDDGRGLEWMKSVMKRRRETNATEEQ